MKKESTKQRSVNEIAAMSRLVTITEKCDVCGCDCQSSYLCRSVFSLGPGRPNVVVRHHPWCNAERYFKKVFN